MLGKRGAAHVRAHRARRPVDIFQLVLRLQHHPGAATQAESTPVVRRRRSAAECHAGLSVKCSQTITHSHT